ncbi:urease accessory protein UreD [Pseudooceanicola sp.]|uniref:urease accessory protein UreD n=1 Tax=Pseudooceanicola sp. TaxID=1914328 RepID=UPI0026348694|nr:urease accessory protein UreD [Pseudooceanicola sp.]MDF1854798.1 urease accessory protein UreD [Pseudooceanicola sp.]
MLSAQPRTRGSLLLSARLRGGRSRIGELRQQGALKALFPQARQAALQAVFLNTSGGVTGGDQLTLQAEAEAGAALCLTSQAAERIYRAQPDEIGQVATRLQVGAGGRIDWLPQETILFDGGALDRRLDAEVAADGCLLAVEPLIIGRVAMGETVRDARLTDRWRVRRDGRLIFADTLRLHGDVHAILQSPGVAGGAGAMAALLLVAPHAEDLAARLNTLLAGCGACSAIRPGVLFARILARDGFALRQSLIPAIRLLSGGEIPRPWML